MCQIYKKNYRHKYSMHILTRLLIYQTHTKLVLSIKIHTHTHKLTPGNTKGGNITVLLTSCLTGLESAVLQLTIFVFISKMD